MNVTIVADSVNPLGQRIWNKQHVSPFEHQALASWAAQYEPNPRQGNLRGAWEQARHTFRTDVGEIPDEEAQDLIDEPTDTKSRTPSPTVPSASSAHSQPAEQLSEERSGSD